MSEIATTKKERDLMTHMLGIGAHINKRSWFYRNYGAFGETDEPIKSLVEKGLVKLDGERQGLFYYSVTLEGLGELDLDRKDFERGRKKLFSD